MLHRRNHALIGSIGNYLRKARVARLGTINRDGTPHILPIVFANNSRHIFFAIDNKPKRSKKLRRLANIERNDKVTLLIDRYSENWQELSFLIIYARAEILSSKQRKEKNLGLRQLRRKYVQYQGQRYLPLDAETVTILRLSPLNWVFWRSALRQNQG